MNKPPPGVRALRALSLLVAVLFALGVVLGVGTLFFFGSSKVRPLFGMSRDALENGPTVARRSRDGGVPTRKLTDFDIPDGSY